MKAVTPTVQGPWQPADDFPGYEFSKTSSRVFLRCAACKQVVNQWPIYETQPLKFVHVCAAPEAEVARLRRGLERMAGRKGFVVAAWPWALTNEEMVVAHKLWRGMAKIAENLDAGREWDDPSPKEDLTLKSEVEAATIYDGHATFDGHGNVTISMKEFNKLLGCWRGLQNG